MFTVALTHALHLCRALPHVSSTSPGHLAKAVTSLGGLFRLATPVPPYLLPEYLTTHLISMPVALV